MVTDKYPSIFLRQMEAIFLSIPCSTNIGKRTPDLLGVFLFLFYFVNNYFGGIFKKKIIPLMLVGYEMFMRMATYMYHLTFTVHLWNNMVQYSIRQEYN